jgi:hypothetical protein
MVISLLTILIIVTVVTMGISWSNCLFHSFSPFYSTLRFWFIFWSGLLIGKYFI